MLADLLIRERVFRYAISAFVLVFGAIGMVSVYAADGPATRTASIIAMLLCATVVPVSVAMSRVHLGAVWWSNRSRWRHGPLLFVAYADLAITASVLTYSDAEYALFGTLLFGVVGAYASHFVRPVACAVHVVFTSAVVVVIGVVMIRSGDHDVAGTIARVATALLAVNGTVALHALYTADVRQSIARTFASATTDSLTGIGNRRAFEQRAHRLIASGVEVVVVLLDVDDFKLINDTVGHGGGDAALVSVARSLDVMLGPDAVVARLGGDEFAAVLPAEAVIAVEDLAQVIRAAVSGATGFAVSVGAARLAGPASQPSEALRAAMESADANLYAQKRVGARRGLVSDPS